MDSIKQQLEQEFDSLKKLDVHTHLYHGSPSAGKGSDLIFYHMFAAELRSAGMDTSFLQRMWGREEAQDLDKLLDSAEQYLPLMANTALARALGAMARDLYGIQTRVSEKGFIRKLTEAVENREPDFQWADRIFDMMNMEKAVAPLPHIHSREYHRKHSQHVTDAGDSRFGEERFSRLAYSLERGPFRAHRDMKRYMEEMDKFYGIRPDTRDKALELLHSELADAKENGICTQVKWLSPDVITMEPDDDIIEGAFAKARKLEKWTEEEVSHLNAMEMKVRLDHALEEDHPFQICVTSVYMNGLQYTVPYTPEKFQRIVARWIGDYPDVNFDVVNCDYAFDQFFASLARTHRNVFLTGIWWHAMSEGWIEDIMYRRILMVPISKLNGFFSDAYSTEWVYGKLFLMKKGIVNAFERAVREEMFSLDEAKAYLGKMMYENPKKLFGL